jgi:hypothetical protein
VHALMEHARKIPSRTSQGKTTRNCCRLSLSLRRTSYIPLRTSLAIGQFGGLWLKFSPKFPVVC